MSLPRSSSGNVTTQACAACKYQRRKCAPDCILAPYFPHDRKRQFLNAHKLFGVSNITKIIKNLNPPDKDEAMRTIIFQSDVRATDPVGGCYKIILELQRQIEYSKAELDLVLHQLSLCRAQAQAQQEQQHHDQFNHPQDDNNHHNNNTTDVDDPTDAALDLYDPFIQYHYATAQSNDDNQEQEQGIVVQGDDHEQQQHLHHQVVDDANINLVNAWTTTTTTTSGMQDSSLSCLSTSSLQDKHANYVNDQSPEDDIKPLLDINDVKFETDELVERRFVPSTQLVISS